MSEKDGEQLPSTTLFILWRESQDPDEHNPKGHTIIICVSGGPGSGKSTQCAKIVSHFGFCHLNAGDLLEAEAEAGSEYSKMIKDFKKERRLVPSDLVVKLLQQAMQRSRNKKFLVDGFPRNEENIAAAERIVGTKFMFMQMKFERDFVLFLDCSEGEMTRRLLNRNQIVDVCKLVELFLMRILCGLRREELMITLKRHQVYFECTVPVVNYYSAKGKVRKIDAERPPEEVFEVVKEAFYKLEEKREESMP
ncbi:hypothetical protein DVH24_032087 [Malus domestica]|uniref:adenylate kinase n=1 Tax=Malus domestica TaxID=3750 RepID=A0A498J2M6_MALDO|nr:hypothetical protein DVH24_032087 [Malus domestica]